ncbi:MAG TPA: cytochrome c biogenesis protein ResB, partial [Candidatus Limnocylindria bacterium]
MSRSTASLTTPARADRLAGRLLRLAGDARLGVALLLLAAGWNALAAALPDGRRLLDGALYPILLGLVALSGMASVAVRLPPAWREWRHPSVVPPGSGATVLELPVAGPMDERRRRAVAGALKAAGFRLREEMVAGRWTIGAVKRGWARFAGIAAHLAIILLLLGAGVASAFAAETTFGLLPGEQALLDAPRPGFTASVRLDAFDATFGADGRPTRLDAHVTFLRDGRVAGEQVIRVNEPGHFDGYLVHGWTYGPAARIEVATLGGRTLLAAGVALDGTIDGRPGTLVDLPSIGRLLGVTLVDASSNTLAIGLGGSSGLVDAVRLAPGETRRVGDLEVRHAGMTSYLTFLSRRDPGMALLFAGG